MNPQAAAGEKPAARPPRRQDRDPNGGEAARTRRHAGPPTTSRPTTVRISVNIPLACRQWLSDQARRQQRFVSEVLMEAIERYGDEARPPGGRARRVAVPDGTICNIVLAANDRQRIDELAARKSGLYHCG